MVAPAVARAGAARKAASARKGAGVRASAAKPAGGSPPAPQAADQLLNRLRPAPAQIGNVGRSAGAAARSLTLRPPRRLSANDASGFAFGLIVYAIALAGIKHGPAGVRGWIAAKFINQPMSRGPS